MLLFKLVQIASILHVDVQYLGLFLSSFQGMNSCNLHIFEHIRFPPRNCCTNEDNHGPALSLKHVYAT